MDVSSGLDHISDVAGDGAALAAHLADFNNPHQVTPAQLNLEIGVDVQAYSAILTATTASFLTAHETKLGHISVTQAVDLDAIEARVNELDASVILKGVWDASAGTFPGSGAAQAGWSYIVSVAGTVDGVAFNVNDRIIAIVDNASTGTFAANWFKADYTDQVLTVAGKTGTVTLQVADITDMSANGRSLVSAADYAAMKTLLAITAADITNASANGRSLITAADYSAMRTLLGLVIGTNVQAQGATLTALEALNFVQGDVVYFSADDTPVRLAKGTAGQRLIMNAGATAPVWATPVSFKANKAGVAQTGIVSVTPTQLTFGTEEWDDGAHFAANAWTPAAGKYIVGGSIYTSANIVDQAKHTLMLYRNGSLFEYLCDVAASGTSGFIVAGETQIIASGTDVFTLWYNGGGAGDKTVSGAINSTWFHGRAI